MFAIETSILDLPFKMGQGQMLICQSKDQILKSKLFNEIIKVCSICHLNRHRMTLT